jgi:hypothetical protein
VEEATSGGTDEIGGAIILLNSSFTAVIITMFRIELRTDNFSGNMQSRFLSVNESNVIFY